MNDATPSQAPKPTHTTARALEGPLAVALREQRSDLNARFAARHRGGSSLDGEAFLKHLREVVHPIVVSVDQHFPERVAGLVSDLYDVSLDLFDAGLLGPETKTPIVKQLWQDVLPEMPRLLARATRLLAGGLSNAAQNLATQTGAQAKRWLTALSDVIPECETSGELLDCGAILAWRCGMVQYRSAALNVSRSLKPGLVARCLELPQPIQKQELVAVLDRMEADPWLTASTAVSGHAERRSVRVVRQVGAFRGFGGVFLRPPIVANEDGRLLVSDREVVWELLADGYGAWLRRVGRGTLTPALNSGPCEIQESGVVSWPGDGKPVRFEQLANPVSSATWKLPSDAHARPSTLAVTLSTSHHVFLLAEVDES